MCYFLSTTELTGVRRDLWWIWNPSWLPLQPLQSCPCPNISRTALINFSSSLSNFPAPHCSYKKGVCENNHVHIHQEKLGTSDLKSRKVSQYIFTLIQNLPNTKQSFLQIRFVTLLSLCTHLLWTLENFECYGEEGNRGWDSWMASVTRWTWVQSSLVAQTKVKNLPAVQETQVRSLGWEIPWRRKWQPTPVFLPGKYYGQRSLAGYSPWGCKD